MWQVYLLLANERQAHDPHEAHKRRLPAGSMQRSAAGGTPAARLVVQRVVTKPS